MTKISKRNYFSALVNLAETGVLAFEGDEGQVEITAEQLAEFARNEIGLIDRKNEKAKERAEKKRQEGDELTAAVLAVVTDELATIADITARVGGEDVSTAKVQFRLNQLAKGGQVVKEAITIPASEGQKARSLVAYRLAE